MSNTYDSDTHVYTITGRRVPSVTGILDDVMPGHHADDWYLQRGTAVHACCAMIARGVQFEHDPQIVGQVAACRQWFADNPGVAAEGVEVRLYNDRMMYAGTADLIGTLNRRAIVLEAIVLDWKSHLAPQVEFQLAAYALAHEVMTGRQINKGIAVALLETGRYKQAAYDLRRAKQEWASILTVYNLRRKCGIEI